MMEVRTDTIRRGKVLQLAAYGFLILGIVITVLGSWDIGNKFLIAGAILYVIARFVRWLRKD